MDLSDLAHVSASPFALFQAVTEGLRISPALSFMFPMFFYPRPRLVIVLDDIPSSLQESLVV